MTSAPALSIPRQVLSWALIGAVWIPVFAVTLLAWAWRDSDNPGLLFAAMVAELALLGLIVAQRRVILPRLADRVGLRWAALSVILATTWLAVRPPAWQSPPGPGKKVAVVGAGAGGMHAAWMLDRMGADVTVFEAAPYVGGHAYAYPFIADDGTVVPIDTGFMFGSPTSYMEMKALLTLYGVGRTQTDLSMSGNIDGRLWASGMEGLDPELLRLHELADQGYTDTRLNLVPFWAWLWWHGFDATFQRTYLQPMLSVLFITDRGMYNVSTRFMLNMLAGPTRWLDYRQDAKAWVVEGGSSAYYAKLSEALHGHIRTLSPVNTVQREGERVRVRWRGPQGDEEDVFDAAVLAVHAEVAQRILVDATPFERFVLGEVRYDPGDVVVHTDASMFPEDPLRRSYFFEQAEGDERWTLHSLPARSQRGGVTVTPEPVVSLNATRSFEGERFRRGWRHHRQDLWHLAMMLKLMPAMQGAGNVWYAGDWVTFIGHGPAMATGMAAACGVGGKAPRADLPTEPCVEVTLIDALPSAGVEQKVQTICGERGVFEHAVGLACTGKVGP
jgi:predicted NAD/FAD-binding protein